MHKLNLALMKDKENLNDKSKDYLNFISGTSKSKSESMWVFEDDSNEVSEKHHS